VVVVDEHPKVRRGFRTMADSIQEVIVLGDTADEREALTMANDRRSAFVMIDLDQPFGESITTAFRITEQFPGTQIIVLTVHDEEDDLQTAIDTASDGFQAEASDLDDSFEGLSVVGNGAGTSRTRAAAGTSSTAERGVPKVRRITPREREILGLLAEGFSARRIAVMLGVGERTVTTHIDHLYRKVGVNNRVEAIREGVRLGLVQIPAN
jgi:DNA-binding NarL/FixJ family response regulator